MMLDYFRQLLNLKEKKSRKEKQGIEKIKTDSQFDTGTNRELVLKPRTSFGSKYNNSTAALRSLHTIQGRDPTGEQHALFRISHRANNIESDESVIFINDSFFNQQAAVPRPKVLSAKKPVDKENLKSTVNKASSIPDLTGVGSKIPLVNKFKTPVDRIKRPLRSMNTQ